MIPQRKQDSKKPSAATPVVLEITAEEINGLTVERLLQLLNQQKEQKSAEEMSTQVSLNSELSETAKKSDDSLELNVSGHSTTEKQLLHAPLNVVFMKQFENQNQTENLQITKLQPNVQENGSDTEDNQDLPRIEKVFGLSDNWNEQIETEPVTIKTSSVSKRIPRKKSYCLFCRKLVTVFRRHIFRIHQSEEEVMNILKENDPNLKERKMKIKIMVNALKKRGNNIYNTEQSARNEDVLPVRRPKGVNTVIDRLKFTTCLFCLGMYSKITMYRHKKKCLKNPMNPKNKEHCLLKDKGEPLNQQQTNFVEHSTNANLVNLSNTSVIKQCTNETGQISTKKELKTHFCIFCRNLVANFRCHLYRHHRSEEAVLNVLNEKDPDLNKRTRKRRLMLDTLRKEGVMYSSIQTTNNSAVVTARIPEGAATEQEWQKYETCFFCKGTYIKKTIEYHKKRCYKNPINLVGEELCISEEEDQHTKQAQQNNQQTQTEKEIELTNLKDQDQIVEQRQTNLKLVGLNPLYSKHAIRVTNQQQNCQEHSSSLNQLKNIGRKVETEQQISESIKISPKKTLKKNFCPLCKALVTNFHSHVFRYHRFEDEVIKVLKEQDHNLKEKVMKRRALLDGLRKKGNLLYKSIQRNRNKYITPFKTQNNKEMYINQNSYSREKILNSGSPKQKHNVLKKIISKLSGNILTSEASKQNTNETSKISSRKTCKQNFCPFCRQLVSNYHRHIFHNHSLEDEVMQVLNDQNPDLQERKRKRRILLGDLKKRGDLMFKDVQTDSKLQISKNQGQSVHLQPKETKQDSDCEGQPSRSGNLKQVNRTMKNFNELSKSGVEDADIHIIFHNDPQISVGKKAIKHFCLYCRKIVSLFSRHIFRNHRLEDEVAKFLNEEINDAQEKKKKKRMLLDELRKTGNFIYNSMQTNVSENMFSPLLKHKGVLTVDEKFFTCLYCLGTYRKSNMVRHKRKCIKTPKKDWSKAEKLQISCQQTKIHEEKKQFHLKAQVCKTRSVNILGFSDNLDKQTEAESLTFENNQKSYNKVCRKSFCLFCRTIVTNFHSHILRKHRYEDEVVTVFKEYDSNLREKFRKRKILLDELRKKGNYLYNCVQKYRKKYMLPFKFPIYKEALQGRQNQVICPNCSVALHKTTFFMHVKKCKKNTDKVKEVSEQSKIVNNLFKKYRKNLFRTKESDLLKSKLQSITQKDDVIAMAISDPLITSIASRFLSNHTEHKHLQIASIKIRDAARLLGFCKRDNSIKQFADLLNPEKLKVITDGFHHLSGFVKETGKVSVVGMPARLRYVVLEGAKILSDKVFSSNAIPTGERMEFKKYVEDFVQIFKNQTQYYISVKNRDSAKIPEKRNGRKHSLENLHHSEDISSVEYLKDQHRLDIEKTNAPYLPKNHGQPDNQHQINDNVGNDNNKELGLDFFKGKDPQESDQIVADKQNNSNERMDLKYFKNQDQHDNQQKNYSNTEKEQARLEDQNQHDNQQKAINCQKNNSNEEMELDRSGIKVQQENTVQANQRIDIIDEIELNGLTYQDQQEDQQQADNCQKTHTSERIEINSLKCQDQQENRQRLIKYQQNDSNNEMLVLSSNSDGSEQVLSSNSDGSEQVFSSDSDGSEQVLSSNSDESEQLLSSNSDESEQVLSSNSDGSDNQAECFNSAKEGDLELLENLNKTNDSEPCPSETIQILSRRACTKVQVDPFMLKKFSTVLKDDVGVMAMSDPLITAIGSRFLSNHNKPKHVHPASVKMRDAAKLLAFCKKNKSVKQFSDLLSSDKLKIVMEGFQHLSGYEEKTGDVSVIGMPARLRYVVLEGAKILSDEVTLSKAIPTRERNAIKKYVKGFMNLFEKQSKYYISVVNRQIKKQSKKRASRLRSPETVQNPDSCSEDENVSNNPEFNETPELINTQDPKSSTDRKGLSSAVKDKVFSENLDEDDETYCHTEETSDSSPGRACRDPNQIQRQNKDCIVSLDLPKHQDEPDCQQDTNICQEIKVLKESEQVGSKSQDESDNQHQGNKNQEIISQLELNLACTEDKDQQNNAQQNNMTEIIRIEPINQNQPCDYINDSSLELPNEVEPQIADSIEVKGLNKVSDATVNILEKYSLNYIEETNVLSELLKSEVFSKIQKDGVGVIAVTDSMITSIASRFLRHNKEAKHLRIVANKMRDAAKLLEFCRKNESVKQFSDLIDPEKLDLVLEGFWCLGGYDREKRAFSSIGVAARLRYMVLEGAKVLLDKAALSRIISRHERTIVKQDITYFFQTFKKQVDSIIYNKLGEI